MGNNVMKWTTFSCHTFKDDQTRSSMGVDQFHYLVVGPSEKTLIDTFSFSQVKMRIS